MRKKTTQLSILLLLISIPVMAQRILGTVSDESSKPVPGASVSILNSNWGTITNTTGQYELTLTKGQYTISISAVGYASVSKSVLISDGNNTLNFKLEKAGKTLDEVVVTADKTEANLQKTPIAVTALNAKKIADYRIWTGSDLTAVAPSTYTVEHGNSTSATFVNIRGAMGFTNEQAVATYVDGVYQFEFFSAPLNFNNIERIEILRGPQGTLYGRNAFSGVINIITKKPGNKPSGYAQVDLGNYGQQRYSIGLSGPLVKNKLFGGFGLQLNQRGAVYENPTLNQKHFDGRKAFNGNIALKYLASDQWTIEFNARTESNNDKGAYPWVATDSIARNEPFKAFGNWPNTERRTNTNASFAVKYFGKKFNFISITSGIQYHLWYPDRYDFDFTSARLFSGNGDSKQNQFTQEIRFSSPANAGRFKWTTGLFAFLEKTKNTSKTFFEEDFAIIDPNAPYTSITYGSRKNRGIAVFGQGTYSLTSKFDITLGARYDTERRQLTQRSAFEQGGVEVPLTEDSTFSRNFSAFTPKVILSYQANDNIMLYASYAKGFRIGGFNFNNIADRTYDPETSNNYEAGIKSNFLNRTLRINFTAFFFQQKDQQVSTTRNGIDYAILNVGDMNNFGLESEISYLPFKNLQLDWTASTSNSKYTRLELYDGSNASTKNYVGNKAIYNPAFQSLLAAQYNLPLGNSKNDLTIFIRGEYKYVGEYQLNFENTESQKGYNLFNTRFGISAKHFEVALWGRNLTDTRYMAWGTFASYMLGSPRMIGGTVTLKL